MFRASNQSTSKLRVGWCSQLKKYEWATPRASLYVEWRTPECRGKKAKIRKSNAKWKWNVGNASHAVSLSEIIYYTTQSILSNNGVVFWIFLLQVKFITLICISHWDSHNFPIQCSTVNSNTKHIIYLLLLLLGIIDAKHYIVMKIMKHHSMHLCMMQKLMFTLVLVFSIEPTNACKNRSLDSLQFDLIVFCTSLLTISAASGIG